MSQNGEKIRYINNKSIVQIDEYNTKYLHGGCFMIVKEEFENFVVYKESECHQFCYITISQASFYEDFISYILDFKMLKKHATINLGIEEDLSLEDYNEIYNRLRAFVDLEKIYNVATLDKAIVEILDEELIKDSADLRKDKWGRIGEYIFNIILDSYFNLDCIVRKFALNTSRNMSVYGIDTVHCSLTDNTFYFGESKMVSDIKNGIKLIQKSLSCYEAQISEEYYTIRNNNFMRNEDFLELFDEGLKRCLRFTDLIKQANITTIGIPVFISHGGYYDTVKIFEELRKIPIKKLFGLETKYYLISVPIIDKNKFREMFVEIIRKKIEECEKCIQETI